MDEENGRTIGEGMSERKGSTKKENDKFDEFKRSESQFVENLKRGASTEPEMMEEDNLKDSRLEQLIKQAEKYASFLLSKHKSGLQADFQAKNGISKGKRGNHVPNQREEDELISTLRNEMTEDGDESVRLTAQPSLLANGTLKDYQMVGLNWLISLHELGINGILADEMGLGKTIQTIAFLAFLQEYKSISGPHLIVAPNTVLTNWVKEFTKWYPSCRVVKLYARKELREEVFENELIDGQFDVCITSYEAINKCQVQLAKFRWNYIMVDEAHRLKNELSLFSQNLRKFRTNLKLLITGTPLQNNVHELWSLLNFIMPELFNSSEMFDTCFTAKEVTAGQTEEAVSQRNVQMINALHKILKPFILRRTKDQLAQTLPPKKEIQVYVGLSPRQVDIYKSILLRKSPTGDGSHYMNVLMQLRKCCNHPYLFSGIEDDSLPLYGEHLVEASGKMVVLDKLLRKLFEGGNRVLLFSQMTQLLSIVEDYCIYRGYKYCRIDGDTNIEERDRQIESFNKPSSQEFIFLLSTRAGGLGINLATADTVILYDSDWNPQVDLQAMDRAHRIGQTKNVNVYRLICENTVEEKVIERQMIKLRWDTLVIQKGRIQQKSKELSKEDLESLVNYGASNIFKATNGTITDEDLDTLLARGRAKADKLSEDIDQQMKAKFSALSNLSISTINVYDFDGADYNDRKKKDQEALERERDEKAQVAQRNRLGKREGPTYQFVEKKKNKDRLLDLLNKENDFKHEQLVRKGQPSSEGEFMMKDLTEEERDERDILMTTGFANWTKNDFQAFLRGTERFGRKAYAEIAELIGTKADREVKEYAAAFWRQGPDDLSDWDKILRNIERGEEIRREEEESIRLLSKAAEGCTYYDDVQFLPEVYQRSKSKLFQEDHDRFLVFYSARLGYNNWPDIRETLRHEAAFELDPYMRSRSDQDLSKRLSQIIKHLKNEEEERATIEKAERKKEREREKKEKELAEKQSESKKTSKGRSNTPQKQIGRSNSKSQPKTAAKKAGSASSNKKSRSQSSPKIKPTGLKKRPPQPKSRSQSKSQQNSKAKKAKQKSQARPVIRKTGTKDTKPQKKGGSAKKKSNSKR